MSGNEVTPKDRAYRALRASGEFPGIGGRTKAGGHDLVDWSRMPPKCDYLRLGMNGRVLNPGAHPTFARADEILAEVNPT